MGIITLPPPDYSSLGVGSPDGVVYSNNNSVPTGVESVYQYNGLTMNDLTTFDRIRISRIEGLGDADVRDQRELHPSRHGEEELVALYGGRTVVLTGRIESYTLNKLRDMQMALREAFAPLVSSPLLVLTGRGFARDHIINCRKVQPIQMTEEQKDFQFFRDFMITLRAPDPRILSREIITSSTDFASASVAGDSVLQPANRGNFTSLPVIVITGPVVNPQVAVQQWEGGAALKLTATLASGEERWIDTATRRIYDQDGNSRFGEFILGSSWLELPPGTSDFNFWGDGLTSESSVTVYHQHSWI